MENETLEERVRRIPLPNELPQGLDFSGIPAAALKSATLESLIGQNEDLMARLSVSLRKINELETNAAHADERTSRAERRLEALREQYMILSEKDRMSTERGRELQRHASVQRERATALERRFTDAFVQGQAFQRRLVRLERYRARIRGAARDLRGRAREAARLTDALAEARREHQRVVHAFETRLAEARQQVSRFESKALERDRLVEENLKLTNQLVEARRQAEAQRLDAQSTIDRLNQRAEAQRLEVTELKAAREGDRAELERYAAELPQLSAEREALGEQVESLQALWAHKQRELELLEEKHRNLKALNQDLSVKLNEGRRELASRQHAFETERFSLDARVRALAEEIKCLRRQAKDSIA